MQSYKILKNLCNRVVLITGASSGLGEQVAYAVAKKGAIVVVCARRLNKLQDIAATCRHLSGRQAFAYQLDLKQPNQIEKLVNDVEENVGPIDVVINNAGFGLMENVLEFEMDVAEEMFKVNVLGLMYMTKYAALKMAQRKRGLVVNIASSAGKIATPKAAIYAATKAAVISYSNALRLEVKPLGIHVLTVNPGPIRTDFFDFADKSGKYLEKVGDFVLNPEIVATRIVSAIGTNKRELNIPGILEVAHHLYEACPRLGDYFAGQVFNKK